MRHKSQTVARVTQILLTSHLLAHFNASSRHLMPHADDSDAVQLTDHRGDNSGSLPSAQETLERILAERRLVRKLDCRLLPAIVALYILNYIDRFAITAARLKGFERDLGLSDLQYSVVLSILYASYAPAQIPSNMILNKMTRPSIYIGVCVVAWGLASALTGLTQNYGEIIACRVLLGLPEAAFYPGVVYLLSCWYTKKELTLRSCIFFTGSVISNAFGSLIAAGIFSGMEGLRGIRAWRWLFLIEGSTTMTVGFLMMWILPDFPHNTRWVTPAERHLAQTRTAADAGEADKDSDGDSPLNGLKKALRDPIVLMFAMMAMCQQLGTSFSQFFPTLASTLGFNPTISLLLAAAPWVLSATVCCINAWHADKTGERFFHLAVWWWGLIIGYIISLSTMSFAGRYVSMFLMACSSAGVAMLLPWVANAVPRPPAKRAAALGVVNGWGNIGSLIGSYVWKTQFGPAYHQSMIISLGATSIAIGLAIVICQLLVAKNKRFDADETLALTTLDSSRVKEAAVLQGITYEEAMERRKGFRYLH
ncbi:MFS general substrate transporter [Mycena galericulata]|nr:MFS general substrate transporter [Mycena galericulata]